MYGLFVNAPVLIAAPLGMLVLASRAGFQRRLSAQLAFIALPYVLTVTHFAMWWGGFSSPARFLVPLLPSLAVPIAVGWASLRARSVRIVFAGGLAVTAGLSTLLATVDRGRLAYFDRGNVYALWTEWASRTADLSHALPSYFARVQRQQPGDLFFVEAAVWLCAIGLGVLAVREVERRGLARSRGSLATCAGAAMAFAVMIAVTVVWRLEDVDGKSPASAVMNLLRRVGQEDRLLAMDLTGRRMLSSADLVRRTELRLAVAPRQAAAPREDRALFAIPAMPAGEYRLGVDRAGGGGWLMAGIGVGRDQFALVTERAEAFDRRRPDPVSGRCSRAGRPRRRGCPRSRPEPVRPSGVDPLTQRESGGRSRASRGPIRPCDRVLHGRAELSGARRHLARWCARLRRGAAAGRAAFVDCPAGTQRPVDNVVVARSGAWSEALRLAPGEERRVDVPIDPSRGAALVTFQVTSGFRPNETDPTSRDARFLGAFVRLE